MALSKKILIFCIILPLTISSISGIAIPLILNWDKLFPPKPPKPNPVVVKLGYVPFVGSLATEIAFEKGFFPSSGNELNLKRVEKVAFSNSEALITALSLGKIQISSSVSIVPMANVEANHPGSVRVFSVSKVYKDKSFDAILVPKTSSIYDITSLKSERIGTFPGTTATSVLKHFLKQRNIPTANLRFIQIPPPLPARVPSIWHCRFTFLLRACCYSRAFKWMP